jgi:hypothetical protein
MRRRSVPSRARLCWGFWLALRCQIPGERNDLSREHPEVVRGLSQALEAWINEMNTASKAS